MLKREKMSRKYLSFKYIYVCLRYCRIKIYLSPAALLLKNSYFFCIRSHFVRISIVFHSYVLRISFVFHLYFVQNFVHLSFVL